MLIFLQKLVLLISIYFKDTLDVKIKNNKHIQNWLIISELEIGYLTFKKQYIIKNVSKV